MKRLSLGLIASFLLLAGCSGGSGIGSAGSAPSPLTTTGSVLLRVQLPGAASEGADRLAEDTTTVTVSVVDQPSVAPVTQTIGASGGQVTLNGVALGPATLLVQTFNHQGLQLTQDTPAVVIQAGTNSVAVSAHFIADFVYTTNQQDNSLGGFELDPNTGALQALTGFSASPTGPLDGVADRTGQFLFIDESSISRLATFQINPATGALTLLSNLAPAITGNHPEFPQVDPTNRFLYIANIDDSTVSGFQINAQTGQLTPVPGSPISTATPAGQPVTVTIDPTGHFVYSANSATNSISAFVIDQTTGALSRIGTQDVTLAQEVAQIVINPSTNLAYAVSGQASVYSVLPVNADGSLGTALAGSPFADEGGGNRTVFDGTDRFLFSCDKSATSPGVHAYTVSAAGPLQDNGSVSTGSGVDNFQIDPTGQFVMAPAAAVETLTEFSVNQASGVLTQGPTPVINTGFHNNTLIVVPAPGAPLL